MNDFKTRQHNVQVYEELTKDLTRKKEGLFSFVIRVSAGDIVDYVIMDNITPTSSLDIFDAYEPKPARVSSEDRESVSEN